MLSVDCMSFIFPPGLVMPFVTKFTSEQTNILTSTCPKPPLSAVPHPWVSLPAAQDQEHPSLTNLCADPFWKPRITPPMESVQLQWEWRIEEVWVKVGCGERLWDRRWCCRKVLFMAFSLVLFWSYWDELCVPLCSKGAGQLLGVFAQWGFVLD